MPQTPAAAIEAVFGKKWSSSIWRLRLMGGPAFFLPDDGPDTGNGSTGRYWALSLIARSCATAALSVFEFGPCIGAELVAMHASHIAGTITSSTQYWISPTASALAAVTIAPRINVFVRADVAVPNTQRTFWGTQDFGGSLRIEYNVSSFALRAGAGLEVLFF